MLTSKKLRKEMAFRLLVKYVNKKGYRVHFVDCLKEQSGYTDFNNKVVLISLRWPNGTFYPKYHVLHTLAHEAQHVKHFDQGKHKRYYYNCGIKTGIKAEQDCHNFADEYVRKTYGIILHSIYPIEAVIKRRKNR